MKDRWDSGFGFWALKSGFEFWVLGFELRALVAWG